MSERAYRVGASLAALAWIAASGAFSYARTAQVEQDGAEGMAHVDRAILAAQFASEERLDYGIGLGRLRIGDASLRVERVQDPGGVGVAEVADLRAELRVQVGAPFLKVEETKTSWIGTAPFRSLSLETTRRGLGERPPRRFRFDQQAGVWAAEEWREDAGEFVPLAGEDGGGRMPEGALDELAALLLARWLPLADGQTYTLARYFNLKENPMTFRVLGRKVLRVPAGKFRVIAIELDIPGVDAFRGFRKPKLYVTDDDRRLVVQATTNTRGGMMVAYLLEHRERQPAPTAKGDGGPDSSGAWGRPSSRGSAGALRLAALGRADGLDAGTGADSRRGDLQVGSVAGRPAPDPLRLTRGQHVPHDHLSDETGHERVSPGLGLQPAPPLELVETQLHLLACQAGCPT